MRVNDAHCSVIGARVDLAATCLHSFSGLLPKEHVGDLPDRLCAPMGKTSNAIHVDRRSLQHRATGTSFTFCYHTDRCSG